MRHCHPNNRPEIRDYGPEPWVFRIHHATEKNPHFRSTLWTGQHLQLTVMCIPAGGDIGAEMHADVDQFLCIESGEANVYMGCCQNALRRVATAGEHDAVLIPAGTWHNVVNCGTCPLKLFSIYAPPQHPRGTVHPTKADE